MGFSFNATTGQLDLVGGGGSIGAGTPLVGIDPDVILISDSNSQLQGANHLDDGQVLIGQTSGGPVAANITGTANQVIVTNGAGSIQLSTPQDIAITSTPTFAAEKLGSGSNQVTVSPGTSASARNYTIPDVGTISDFLMTEGTQTVTGTKTFNSVLNADGGIDVNPSGVLSIGANATVINLGNSSATVNILGSVIEETVTDLNVMDPLITLNRGGSAGSGANSGIQIEEAGSPTGYAKTSLDRNSWALKAPNTAGAATITPGASGITLNQSSHDPVTLGTANGLTIVGQVLGQDLSSTSTTGALSSTDWNTFNNKQPAGNYITGLTGDVVATGPGSVTATIQAGAIVDSKVSATANIQLSKLNPLTNGKRLLISSVSGVISEAAALTDGQLFIGSTGNAPVASAITAGAGVTINNAPGSITISNTDNVTGDLIQTSYTSSNDTPVNETITGFAFSNASVRSFRAQVSVVVSATTSKYAVFLIDGIQRGSDWQISQSTTGDIINMTFSITNAGQLQFTKTTDTGFTQSLIKFRAQVTSV